ncbi:glycosyltransferase [Ferruginibacter albus]|uniref:glycosyltransferase n=1 Tax=Ferruginibacter albus TaxID=2875540 RepID=UPI001CC5F517|nr:glycosyltransferase [Ferruginibacter albus]UAY50691.1 glycosyltransferase family protein [Ferruginibacter albus]
MLSVIISTYRPQLFNELADNIKETVGCEYEIVPVINDRKYNIGQAYNIGAANARFPHLCFLHEDVFFHSHNWGNTIIKHLASTAGLIGLAGSEVKTYLPTGWTSGMLKWDRFNVHQKNENYALEDRAPSLVSVIDGVLMATTKELWQKIKFDETQEGFHFYDIDFSLRMSKINNVAVIYDIHLEHFSKGNFNDEWITASLKFHKKHNTNKGYFFQTISGEEKNRIRRFWYYRLSSETISFKNRLAFFFTMGVNISAIKPALSFFFRGKR